MPNGLVDAYVVIFNQALNVTDFHPSKSNLTVTVGKFPPGKSVGKPTFSAVLLHDLTGRT